jgi:hypothetical protein
MLRKIIITWLIVSILGYGMALAADVHNEVMADHYHVIDDNVTSSSDSTDNTDCGHCCHGISHLLGLCYNNTINQTTTRHLIETSYSVSLISFSPHVYLRPPITA